MLRHVVLEMGTDFGRSIDTIWIVMTPLSAVGLCCVLVAKRYGLKRNVVKAGDKRLASPDEKTDVEIAQANSSGSPTVTGAEDKEGNVAMETETKT